MRAEKNYLIAEVESHLKKSDYVILANFTKVTSLMRDLLRNRRERPNSMVKNISLRVAAKALGLPESKRLIGLRPCGRRKKFAAWRRSEDIFTDKQKLEVEVGCSRRKSVRPPIFEASVCLRSKPAFACAGTVIATPRLVRG